MARIFSTTHEHMRVHQRAKHGDWAMRQGAAGGFVAGLVFLVLEMIVAWIGTGDLFLPARMIAGIPLAQAPAQIGTGIALVAGGLFHVIYSILLGMAVAALIARVPAFNQTRGRILTFAAAAGAVIWLVNFYIFAPIVGAFWFMGINALLQLVLHVGFGLLLGYYLDINPPKDLT